MHPLMKSLAAFLLLNATLFAQNPLKAQEEILRSFQSISSHDLQQYATELTSKQYRGRLTGTPEFLNVARWVADNLKAWGLKPAGDDGGFLQYFDKDYTDIQSVGALSLTFALNDSDAVTKHYTFPEHYFPGSNSDSGTVTGEVIYVGHGVTAPELGYDDYRGIDVKDKIVLVDTDVPASRKDKDYASWVKYCYHQYKLNNAVRHGAAGMLYINNIANPNTCFNPGLVYAHVGDEILSDLFSGTGRSHDEARKTLAASQRPDPFSLDKTATISMKTVYHPEGRGCNVLGMIEGIDPELKEEVILVGGHLDGQGYFGEVILPGALDNGSGIVDMLAAARALAQSAVRPKRSILFVFIGGEECGLLGSQHYVAHPVVPMEKTLCYFNLDMVGVGSGLAVWGAQSYPGILSCFETANDTYIHRPFRSSKIRPLGVGRPRSDAWIFQNAGLRALSFGTFYRPGEKRGNIFYHHPGDRAENLNLELMEDVSKLMFLGLLNMANQDNLF